MDVLKSMGTYAVTQNALGRIEIFTDRAHGLKLHFFRSRMPMCASQLYFPIEKRRKLGRWSANRLTPEHYDRAVCTAELATGAHYSRNRSNVATGGEL